MTPTAPQPPNGPDVANSESGASIKVSPSELMDRISILELKLARSRDEQQIDGLREEVRGLRSLSEQIFSKATDEINALVAKLADVNAKLWDIEDQIRVCERDQRFDRHFVNLARSVYQTNDERSSLRSEINLRMGWVPYDGKIHPDYR